MPVRHCFAAIVAAVLISATAVDPSAHAASAADVAAGLSSQIVEVVSGGAWEDGGKKGYYRAVLVAPADAGSGAQIFMQWMQAAGAGTVPSIVAVAPIKEYNDQKLVDATINADTETPGEFIVYIEPRDPSKAAQQSFTLTASKPGIYTIAHGPIPE